MWVGLSFRYKNQWIIFAHSGKRLLFARKISFQIKLIFKIARHQKVLKLIIDSNIDNTWMYLMAYGSSLPLLPLPVPVVQPQWIQVKMRENGRQLRRDDGPSTGRRDSVPVLAAGRHPVPEEAVPEDAAVPTVEGASSMRVTLLEGSFQPAKISMLALSCSWESEYDLSNFNVLYL